MEIKSISGNPNFFNNQNAVKKQAETKQEPSKDRLEISAEAKVFESASKKVKNLEEIRQKIASNYYNSEEVIQKVADKILKEISE